MSVIDRIAMAIAATLLCVAMLISFPTIILIMKVASND